jgi:hypothetical protein
MVSNMFSDLNLNYSSDSVSDSEGACEEAVGNRQCPN